jgi:hypothetical protein
MVFFCIFLAGVAIAPLSGQPAGGDGCRME